MEYFMALKRFLALFTFALSICCTHLVSAAGIAIIEQNVSGFKTGYAGASTSIDDASAIVFNPAALSRLNGTNFMVGGHILSPTTKYKDGSSTLNGVPLVSNQTNTRKDAGKTAYIPNFFASHQINDKFFVGFGVFAPFGLGIEYKNGWQGRYHGTKNDMKTLNINPSFAYKPHDKLTFGFGVSGQYVNAVLENAIDFGGLASSRNIPGIPQKQDGMVKVEGHDWGYGFNFGVLYEPSEDTRFAASYRSSIGSSLKGDAKFKRSTPGDIIMNRTGLFKDSRVQASITFPESAIFGIYHKFAPKWAFMADLQLTNWRRFKEIRLEFKNPVQPDDIIPLRWKSVPRIALGLHHYFNDSWTFGFGGGFDKSPVRDEHRSVRIPDSDRVFFNTGASAKIMDNLFFDLAYGHIFFKKAKINLVSSTKGNLNGHINTKVNIFSAGLRYKL